MEKIQKVKAGFQSLTEAIETTSPAGRMMMQMVGACAEFERAMLRERTCNGLNAARKEGRGGGRRPKLKTHQEQEIQHLWIQDKRPLPLRLGCSMCIRLRYRACLRVIRGLQRDLSLKCIYHSTAPQTPTTKKYPRGYLSTLLKLLIIFA